MKVTGRSSNREIFMQGYRNGIPIGFGYFAVAFSFRSVLTGGAVNLQAVSNQRGCQKRSADNRSVSENDQGMQGIASGQIIIAICIHSLIRDCLDTFPHAAAADL